MRRAALLILGAGALLLTPGATGLPDVPGDPTPPVVTPVITGTLGAAGWYTSNVTVNWSVTDPESIILSTSGCDARTLSSDTTGTRLTCTATSDGGETTVSKNFQVDKTAPAASAAASRPADVNGWYNHELGVSFNGSDGTSGLESCTPSQTYGGPDSAAASVTGACRDRAGNVAQTALPFKYDETAPSATPTARAPDANGWYNHAVSITFQGADGTAGIASCTTVTYSGPDDPSVALPGTCSDRAGNSSASSVFTLKYDETAPSATATASRQAGVNGWYNAPLTVTFTGADATSGLDSCDVPKTYSGPDGATASVTGACRDRAGNAATRALAFQYDATPPQAAATPSRQPNANGWYNAPLSVSFAATDATSTVDSCDAAQSYSGPDSSSASLSGACRDKAGNAATASLPLKYDATAPQTTASPSRQPTAAGWFNAPLTVSFAGTDAMAGIDSCDAGRSYAGPDAAAATVTGFCRDRAGNSDADSYALKYDATAPTVTAMPSRPANANGWYREPLTVTFAGSDVLSGLASCEAPRTYAGPDSGNAAVSGTCLDKAGNSAAASLPLRYDATAPGATATPSRQPNENGWYRAALTVTFAGSDVLSGLDSCSSPITYSGPDTATGAVSGTCLDKAGNGTLASLPVKYDATAPMTTAAPSREPNGAGWYNAALSVGFVGTDAMSGTASCTAPQGYSGPDSSVATMSGSCTDRAGNASSGSFAFKYDATPPEVSSAAPVRPPDRAGWYNRPIAVDAQGTDATSGIASCAVTTYAGPDGDDARIPGSCVDRAGNLGSKWFSIDYDATAPEATALVSRPPDANGWYKAPLTVSYAGADSVSGLESCAAPESYGGPDSASAVMSGICLDRAGNAGVASYPLSYDATAPQVTGVKPDRAPDAAGWYNHAVAVGFQGSDETSGIEACTHTTYGGPDSPAASIAGSCRDRAANISAGASFALRYDGTAPSLTRVVAKPGNRVATLSWTASADTAVVEVRRSGRLIYSGTGRAFVDRGLENGKRYRYALTAFDEARNAAAAAAAATPTSPLKSPAAGATVSGPPRLVWKAVPKAAYYNVQVWRGRRILSVWPRETSVRLRRSWMYSGRRYSLTPGRYSWFVWPGYGRPAERKFGPLLGSSSFVVR